MPRAGNFISIRTLIFVLGYYHNMLHRPLFTSTPHGARRARILVSAVVACLAVSAFGAYLILETKHAALQSAERGLHGSDILRQAPAQPFPISVDPGARQIVHNDEVEAAVQTFAAPYLSARSQDRWLDHVLARLSTQTWFQTLATPSTRIIIILPGERKEQIAHNLGQILGWDASERTQFITELTTRVPAFPEGTFFPGRYVVPADASPLYMANLVHDRFTRAVLERYPSELETVLPLIETLTLASLLERESYHFSEMRVIAGVIWNRLFQEKRLQIDATLQYAKADAGLSPDTWWPVPRPDDKFIDSPYNTYQHHGLPPSPIANPGVASILAALNPTPTTCLFYFHDRNGGFHCSDTYEQHVQGLRVHYGQGR